MFENISSLKEFWEVIIFKVLGYEKVIFDEVSDPRNNFLQTS
jgi:hypothetical protein